MNDGEELSRRTQVIESPKTMPTTYNELPSMDGVPPLLETQKWCTLSLPAHTMDLGRY
jgi:hypothetical protein